jgi:hypothetical protein
MTLPVLAAALQGPGDFFIPQAAVDIAQGFFAMVAAIALGVPIIRAVSRRWERGSTPVTNLLPDLTHRLERIEQAVEAVAIEVERMAEAQRFTAKLMAERQSLPPAEPAGGNVRAAAPDAVRRPDAAR